VPEVAKETHEEILSSNMEAEAGDDNETDKANAKGNHLDHFTSALLNLLSDKGL
jgi:hypothetical protein